jgi:AraC-like DNA-binding protein
MILSAYYTENIVLDPKYGFLMVSEAKYYLLNKHGDLMAIIVLSYTIWGFYLLRIHRNRVLENLSNIEHTNWLKFLVLSFLIYFLAIYFSIIFSNSSFGFIPLQSTFYVISFILMAYVFVIGYIGLKQTSVFVQLAMVENANPSIKKYAKSGLDPETFERVKSEIDEKMKFGKFYLDENMTLTLLASKVELNPTYLSQVINQGYGINFHDFVNKYRVDAAKQMLRSEENDHLSFLGIALECGFKSKSTFNKFFKKYSGMTPGDFKRNK